MGYCKQDRKLALFFGCESPRYLGHYLHGPIARTISPSDYYRFPWTIENLDGGLLRNGRVTDVDGKVNWTCGGRPELWFAFYWWDRGGDSRPGSNSGFYVRGFDMGQQSDAFDFACKRWHWVVARQSNPLELVE